MRAIILAAGRGSRMKVLTEERPKCLVELRGKALLDWQLEALRCAGISEIGIVTGYKREMLADRGLVEFHNSRWAETNMVSSLACADAWLKNSECVISYSDIFYSSDGVKSLINSSENIAVTYDKDWLKIWEKRFHNPLLDAETFRTDKNGYLIEIGNKPDSIAEVEGQYMGLLRMSPEGWEEINRIRAELPADLVDQMHMTGTLQRVIQKGRVLVKAIQYNGEWGEVDSGEDLAAYC